MSEAEKKAEDRKSKRDEDDAWETDDEQFVHVHVAGVFQQEIAKQNDVKFVGLDTEEPVVQLGNQAFVGRYEDIVGTALFFAAKDDDENDADARRDPVFEAEENKVDLEYVCKTNRRLVLKRVFLKEKKSE